jgi:hypothetical protein
MIMTNTAQAQYLRIFDSTGDYNRWQSYYINQTIEWQEQEWDFQSFDAEGIFAGDIAAEGGLTVEVPITSITLPALRNAMRFGYLMEITQYEFDPTLGNDEPQVDQRQTAQYVGEVIGMKGRFTKLDVELGSVLAPIGIQLPPRTMTSRLIGVPCQL